MSYAGEHGGCMDCDSLCWELRVRGHRPSCRSPYRGEKPKPAIAIATLQSELRLAKLKVARFEKALHRLKHGKLLTERDLDEGGA